LLAKKLLSLKCHFRISKTTLYKIIYKNIKVYGYFWALTLLSRSTKYLASSSKGGSTSSFLASRHFSMVVLKKSLSMTICLPCWLNSLIIWKTCPVYSNGFLSDCNWLLFALIASRIWPLKSYEERRKVNNLFQTLHIILKFYYIIENQFNFFLTSGHFK